MIILGHSHGQMECLCSGDLIKLEEPVLTNANFLIYYRVVIKAVVECCEMIVDIELHREQVMLLLFYITSIIISNSRITIKN